MCVNGLKKLVNGLKWFFGFGHNENTTNNSYTFDDSETQAISDVLDGKEYEPNLRSDLVKNNTMDSLKRDLHKVKQNLGIDKNTSTEVLFDAEDSSLNNSLDTTSSQTTTLNKELSSDISFVTAPDGNPEVDISDVSFITAPDKDANSLYEASSSSYNIEKESSSGNKKGKEPEHN